MAFVPLISAASVAGEPSDIIFTDLSTGADAAIASRRLYVSNDIGTFLVETGTSTEYEVWPLPLSDTITLSLLEIDTACKIVCQWLNSSNVVLYDYTIAAEGFTEYNENYLYGLSQLLTYNPLLINDNNFWNNFSKMRTSIDAGNKAITRANDLYSAQQCYNVATEIRLAAPYPFNANS